MDVEVSDEENGGETARLSDMAWMSREFHNTGDKNHNHIDIADESTLSGSFLTAALDDMRQAERINRKKYDEVDACDVTLSQKSTEEITNVSRKFEPSIAADDDDDATCSTILVDDKDDNSLAYPSSVRIPLQEIQRNQDQKMGPNEQKYRQHYHSVVSNKIQDFSRQQSQLRNYASMPTPQKQHEQQRVMHLLERLGISSSRGGTATAASLDDDDDQTVTSWEASLQPRKAASSTAAAQTADHYQSSSFDMANNDTVDELMALYSRNADDDDESVEEADTSMVLLSPRAAAAAHSPPIAMDTSMDTSMAINRPSHYHPHAQLCRTTTSAAVAAAVASVLSTPAYDSDSSTPSIELPRAARPFESPDAVAYARHRKRLATTSGKKGADVARRARPGDSCSVSSFDSTTENNTTMDSPSAATMLESSIRGLSLAPEKIFTASQSPILMDDRDSCSSDDFCQPIVSFGDDANDESTDENFESQVLLPTATASTIESTNDTTRERKVHWDWDTAGNVGMKSGATFHLKPLQTKLLVQNTHRHTTTTAFPDPLEFYQGRFGQKLARVFKWLLRRDESLARCSGILFSLAERPIFDLVLKLVLEAAVAEPNSDHQSQGSQSASQANEGLAGNTLIVARSKEDLEAWAQTLREGCSLSVLNHATLPMKQRKTQHSAKTCATFDIVLTTFDAMKASDVTLVLDENGFALAKNVAAEGGWFTSRSASQSSTVHQNKQLSVLHQLAWRRVVFVDVLGQKCFLAKHQTARAEAARVLNARARYVGLYCFRRKQAITSIVLPCFLNFLDRFIFFVESTGKESALTALTKSHKKALQSVASVLRLETHDADETLVTDVMLDFCDEVA